MLTYCPCGSRLTYSHCCGLYIEQQAQAPTPEALMRSRYSAYTLANIDYIKATMKGRALLGFNEQQAKAWAQRVQWLGLTIVNTFPRLTNDTQGYVEFIAFYKEQGQSQTLHERSEFQCHQGKWYYTDGAPPQPRHK